MLEKNRHKRPTLEEILNLEWFDEFKTVNNRGQGAAGDSKFKAYALTTPDSSDIKKEIEEVKKMQVWGAENRNERMIGLFIIGLGSL